MQDPILREPIVDLGMLRSFVHEEAGEGWRSKRRRRDNALGSPHTARAGQVATAGESD